MSDLYNSVLRYTVGFDTQDWLNTFACLTLLGFVGLMAFGRR